MSERQDVHENSRQGAKEDLGSSESNGQQDGLSSLMDQVSKTKEELEKTKSEYLYLRAEFDNYRKNVLKERSDLLKFGSERLIVELLGVLDNFDRARKVAMTPENMDVFRKGMDMVATELKSVLQKNGVSEIESEKKTFDPQIHEAVGAEVSKDQSPGTVLRVFRAAYKLHDRVIRPAQVVIAKDASEEG